MPTVNLDDKEWQQVMGAVAQLPWSVANPLLMKIGEQLQRQSNAQSPDMPKVKNHETPKAARS